MGTDADGAPVIGHVNDRVGACGLYFPGRGGFCRACGMTEACHKRVPCSQCGMEFRPRSMVNVLGFSSCESHRRGGGR